MTRTEATEFATRRVRSYSTWIIAQPSGNHYVTDRKGDATPGELAVAVVRKGTAVVESILPRAWRAA
jgi:hypothetical protein